MDSSRQYRGTRLDRTVFSREAVEPLRCLVAGVGALGSELVRLLGQIGVAEIALVDPDRLEAVNQPHSIFFRDPKQLGRLKVDVVAGLAEQLFPATRFTPHAQEIADLPLGHAQTYDLVLSATDSAIARAETAWLARRLHLPVVDAALLGESWWRGRVSWLPPDPSAACYLCSFTEATRAELLLATSTAEPGCSRRPPTAELASTPVMSGAIASLAVDIAIRQLVATREPVTTREPRPAEAYALELSLEGAASGLERHALTRSATCPWHDPAGARPLRRLRLDQPTLRRAMLAEGVTAIELEWPLVLRARCLSCSSEQMVLTRVGKFRRSACPHCNEGPLLPLETLCYLHRDSPWAERAPAELGFSDPWLASVLDDTSRRDQTPQVQE